ncbi:MAG: DeoR/GlpR family DNA-binding transcription regulator [Oscillospiraceae bacterium]|jgi:DeoR/GlpR family transcriptional regulator of sugar metabolism
MTILERQERILAILAEYNTATVRRLAKELYASESTIRRDLAALERRGKIRRTFGGAVLADFLNREVPLTLREQANMEAKAAIAVKAAGMINDGDTIFLDASSTVLQLVRHLAQFRDLTVVTNGPKTSLSLGELKIRNLCTGGMLLPDSVAYVGAHTCEFFRRFNPNVVFFSCRGVTEDGWLCDSSVEEANVREAMLSKGGKKVFLCDTSKLGITYRYNFVNLREMDEVICEKECLPAPYNRFLQF